MTDTLNAAPKCPAAGTPAWVITFADLMSLLLCFFVLLLSFATVDAIRFKKMADSMRDAFGVQRKIPANEIVMGTSVIAQYFTPAQTDHPTTDQRIEQEARLQEKDLGNSDFPIDRLRSQLIQNRPRKVEDEAEKIKSLLRDEVGAGLVSVDIENLGIVIRIHERGSFPSGSAVLNTGFTPAMDKIRSAVRLSSANVVIAGHSDDIPIHTDWYRSNWELSSARAVTVAHEVLRDKTIDPGRLVIEGYAETKPLVPNDSAENRARNRRVEIILIQPDRYGSTSRLSAPASAQGS